MLEPQQASCPPANSHLMLARVEGARISGIDAHRVVVEVDVGRGQYGADEMVLLFDQALVHGDMSITGDSVYSNTAPSPLMTS